MKNLGPFDFVNSITYSKNDMMSGTENDDLAEKLYVPYLTNKSLSYFPDCIMYANETNIHHGVDNKLQYQYLINSVRPKRRFSKWVKKQEDNDLEAVMQCYGYNRVKAESVLSLLSPVQLEQIKKKLNKGNS